MTPPDIDYALYAGFVRFPSGLDDLTDASRCAACFAPVSSDVCAACGLDLVHPDIATLRDQSRATADLLQDRLVTIGRIRRAASTGSATSAPAGASPVEAAPIEALPVDASPIEALPAPVAAPIFPAPSDPPVLAGGPPPSDPLAGSSTISSSPFYTAKDSAAARGTGAHPSLEPILPSVPAGPIPPAAPKRSSVQVLLLGVGVALLAIAAIFFMVFAFVAFGVFVRALIVGAITAATIAGATLLRRRRLFGTSEAVATLAIVLILLDVWALRANGLLGLDRADGATYWGLALFLTAVGLRGWQHLSGLTAPGVAGAAMLPLGAALAVGGIADSAGSFDAPFFAALAIAAAALVHPIFAPLQGAVDAVEVREASSATAQRFILLAWAAVGLVIGLFTVVGVAPNLTAGVSLGLLALAAVALAHAVVLGRFGAPSVGSARVVAGAGALSAVLVALAPAALALRSDASIVAIAVPVLGAAAVALALEAAVNRAPAGAKTAVSLGMRCTAILAAAFALIPFCIAALGVLQVPATAFLDTRELSFGAVIQLVTVESATAVITLVVLAAAIGVIWLLLQNRQTRWPFVIASALLVVIVALPLLTVFGAVVAGWVVACATGLGWMLWRRMRVRAGVTVGRIVGVFACASGALGYVSSWAGQHTWWVISFVTVALLLVARRVYVRANTAPRAALLGGALGVAMLSVAGLGGLGSGTSVLGATAISAVRDGATGLLILAGIVIVVAALPVGGLLTDLDRRTLFWPSVVVAAASALTLIAGVPLSVAPSWLLLALAVLLLIALVAWSLAPATRRLVPERIVAAVAVAPAVSWMLQSLARLLGLDELLGGVSAPLGIISVIGGGTGFTGGGVVGATAALLVSAAALAGTLRSAPVVGRAFTDIGIALVLVVAVVEVATVGRPLGWLTLLIAAIAVLLQSISADGLFASRSARRLVGWIAFVLGASALWLRLFDASVAAIEPFTLPIAAGLVVIAVLIARVEHRRGPHSSERDHPVAPALAAGVAASDPRKATAPSKASSVAPPLVLAGLLLGLVPSALQGTSGSVVRPIFVTAIAAALLIAARWAPATDRLRPFALVGAVAGAIAVAIASIGRAVLGSLAPARTPMNESPDLWIAVGCVILFVASLAYLRSRTERADETALTVALFIAAGTLLLGAEALRLSVEPGAAVRAVALVIIFAVLHVAASVARVLPSRHLLAWLALGYAVVAALRGLQTGLLDPVEVATLPIALALLASGSWRLVHSPALRSLPALGPGLLVLFIPSLLATATDRDLWRIVLIGVVAIAVIVAGVLLRLQAPFVIASVVVLIHAIGTFSPQIRYIYEATPWWLWVAIGGGLLLFLGATYERRARDLRRTVGRIAALR